MQFNRAFSIAYEQQFAKLMLKARKSQLYLRQELACKGGDDRRLENGQENQLRSATSSGGESYVRKFKRCEC